MAKKKRKKSASRGSVNNIILKTLVNGDKYGYEIIKEVEVFSDGKIELKQPSLYSSLSRFEEKGFVSSYWGDSDIGGRRHYYHLTEKGMDFYNATILKHSNNSPSNFSDEQEIISNVENNEYNNQTKDNVDFDEEDENDYIDEDEISDTEENNNDNTEYEEKGLNNNSIVQTTPIEETDIPAIVNFEPKEETEDLSVIHPFKNTTPIEQEITSISNMTNNNASPAEKVEDDTFSKPNFVTFDDVWDHLSYNAKINTKRCRQTPYKKLHYIKPKKAKKVILDTDGIYKLRDADYVSNKTKKYEPVIIDNVGKRIPDKSINYATYSNAPKQTNNINNTNILDLSDEERRKRNEIFLAKFNSLTKSRYVETKKPEPVFEPKKEPEIDYRAKLDKIISTEERNNKIKAQELEENNLFNYDYDENEPTSLPNYEKTQIEEDKFIDFEPVEFDVKTDDKKYIDNISNFNQSQNNIKINRYQTKSSNAILSDKSYVLINKVKCVFGFILLFLFAIEIALSYVIFNKLNLITDSDKPLIFISGIIALVCSLSFIIPAFVNPNEHKNNSFKLKYSLILGFLTFVISVVLVYCINALMGFELDNFKYYAVKLILPLVLTINFVLTPPIYAIIIKCKKFYD